MTFSPEEYSEWKHDYEQRWYIFISRYGLGSGFSSLSGYAALGLVGFIKIIEIELTRLDLFGPEEHKQYSSDSPIETHNMIFIGLDIENHSLNLRLHCG